MCAVPNSQYIHIVMADLSFKLHLNNYKSHADINKSLVHINILHVNIIMLHVDE